MRWQRDGKGHVAPVRRSCCQVSHGHGRCRPRHCRSVSIGGSARVLVSRRSVSMAASARTLRVLQPPLFALLYLANCPRAPAHSRTHSPRASCSPGIQLQLSMMHEKWMAAKLGELNAGHGRHAHSADHHHHTEHLCAQGSTSILAVLALHSLAEVSVVVRKSTWVEA